MLVELMLICWFMDELVLRYVKVCESLGEGIGFLAAKINDKNLKNQPIQVPALYNLYNCTSQLPLGSTIPGPTSVFRSKLPGGAASPQTQMERQDRWIDG
jgi:hypothetical protein